jgi:hypothetical protein
MLFKPRLEKNNNTKQMKLSQSALNAMPEHSRLRKLLAVELDLDIRSVNKYADENLDNNLLTTVKAVKVISRETGMIQDEIVIEEKVNIAS